MRGRFWLIFLLGLLSIQCRESGGPAPSESAIAGDEDLYRLITHDQPYQGYSLFPDADSIVAGSLNGSNAHRPMVRVSMNPLALSALSGGRLPDSTAFPDGSVIVKEIRENGTTTVLAVMYRDRDHPASGEGWLWAEYTIAGATLFSITSRGSGCVSCHMREQGARHDLVRTFERQVP